MSPERPSTFLGRDLADPPHSERHFTDARDLWWNDDFVALLARRFDTARVIRVLDVGSGQGHFARTWAPHVASDFEITCADRDPRSLLVAREKCDAFLASRSLHGTFSFAAGTAEALPFPSDSFDMVMCQTLLIHVPAPERVVSEMTRVAKPGALVLAAEPNNFTMFDRFASAGPESDAEQLVPVFRYWTRIMHGKRALGLGWNAAGAELPRWFSHLDSVRYVGSDRALAMHPPYETAEQRAALADMRRDARDRIAGWPTEEALRLYVAGGGTEAQFQTDRAAALAYAAAEIARVESGRWIELSGGSTLIAAGRKPGGNPT